MYFLFYLISSIQHLASSILNYVSCIMYREEESMIKNVFTIALMLALVAGFYYSFAHAAEPVGYVTSLKGEVF